MTGRRIALFLLLLLVAASFAVAEGGKESKPGVTPGAAAASAPSTVKESPLLAEMVKRGLIPPVDQRLPVPEDRLVVKPLHEIGRYGGTARTFNAEDPKRPYTSMMLMGTDGPFKATPEAKPGVPLVFKSADHNDNYTVWTLKLRKGLKWSDGYPLTTQEFLDKWKLFSSNPDVNPTVRNMKVTIEDKAVTFYNEYNDKRTVKKEVVDDYTMRFTSDYSYPTLINHLSHPHSGRSRLLHPADALPKAVPPGRDRAAGRGGPRQEGRLRHLVPDVPVLQPDPGAADDSAGARQLPADPRTLRRGEQDADQDHLGAQPVLLRGRHRRGTSSRTSIGSSASSCRRRS